MSSYNEVESMPLSGRFGVAFMYGEDLWCLTLEWDGSGLFELDCNGDKDYSIDYSGHEFSQGRFFIEQVSDDPDYSQQ